MLSEICFSSNRVEEIKDAIVTKGICIAQGIATESAFVEFAGNFGKPYKHRDSEDNAVTRVEHDPALAGRPGFSGFSDGPLDPHTDRSTIESPPELVALFCAQRASTGGLSRVLDGKLLYKLLRESDKELLEFSTQPDRILYSDGKDSYRGSIFESVGEGTYRIRLGAMGMASTALTAPSTSFASKNSFGIENHFLTC